MRFIRNHSLKLFLCFGLFWFTYPRGVLANPQALPDKRPNIVVILTDDQRWDALSLVGKFPFLSTPNMDRLAAEGAYFPNAFVTTSLCSPNRASLLTGAYAHRHGVRINLVNDPDPAIPTFPQLLQASGYDTAYIGKWHMAPTSAPRPGYNYWLSFKSHGTYMNPTLNENGRIFTQQGYLTDILTDFAMRWLRQERGQPFLLILSHKAIHDPYIPAPRHQEAFATAELPQPLSYEDTLADKPKWLRRYVRYGIRRYSQNKSVPESLPKRSMSSGAKTRYLNYLRSLLAVDENLGRVLDTLEAMGELDNTLVIYTSDNGFMLGEHQLCCKQLMYEESIRVPLLIRYPVFVPFGTIRTEMVTSIDIAPTILHIAGVDVPDTVQGHSLLPLLKNEDVEWRKSLFYEYFTDKMWPGIPTILGVRTERWKYIHTPDLPKDIDELYDVQNDPNERTNLASNPQYTDVLETMKVEFTRQIQATNYTPPTAEDTAIGALGWKLRYMIRDMGYTLTKLRHRVKAFIGKLKRNARRVVDIVIGREAALQPGYHASAGQT